MDPLIYKTLLVGDQAVGKSSLLLQYTTEEFRKDYTVTIGLEFGSKEIILDGKNPITIQIWDTAGQEAFKSIIRSFYRNAAAVFIVYSINKRDSFQNVDDWCTEVRQNSHKDVIITLLGNKCDLEQLRQVGYEEGEQKRQQINADLFFETSGKEAKNLDEAFRETAKLISKRFHENEQFRRSIVEEEDKENSVSQPRQSLVKNSKIESQQKKSGCC